MTQSIEWESTGAANEYRYRIVDASASSASSPSLLSAFTYIFYGGGIWRKKNTDEYYLVVKTTRSGPPTLVLYLNGKTLAETQPGTYFPKPYQQTKPFDVRMRAVLNSPSDLLVATTASPLASTKENIRKQQLTPNSFGGFPTPTGYTRTMKTPNLSLFRRGPLEFRSPPSKARHKVRKPLLPVPNDEKVSVKKIYKNTPKGNETPTKETVMWGTASGHARAMGFAGATGARWEWLHLVAHSLGGANASYNLVAGTYDANTRMLPTETKVAEYKESLRSNEYITYKVTAKLEPGTHIAKEVNIQVTFPPRLGKQAIREQIYATNNATYSRAEFDVQRHLLSK